MDGAILACGPYFSSGGMVASLVLFLLAEPLAYYLYVRAFRYRVCAAIPMSRRRAATLAFQRMLIGLIFVGGGAYVVAYVLPYWTAVSGEVIGWIYLYLARIMAWEHVGSRGASIRGWRLVGWIVGGMFVNIAFDVAAVAGLLTGWIIPAVIATVLFVFISILETRGRRPAMLARFTEPLCRTCNYNLTGNLSGICPECGSSIDMATLAKIPASAPDAASH